MDPIAWVLLGGAVVLWVLFYAFVRKSANDKVDTGETSYVYRDGDLAPAGWKSYDVTIGEEPGTITDGTVTEPDRVVTIQPIAVGEPNPSAPVKKTRKPRVKKPDPVPAPKPAPAKKGRVPTVKQKPASKKK